MRRWWIGLGVVLLVSACSPKETGGAAVAADVGCASCHTGTDTAIAPTWHGLWGSEVELSDGSTVIADEEYVRRSIEHPSADVVDGYEARMPTFDLTDEEEDALVEYIRSLG